MQLKGYQELIENIRNWEDKAGRSPSVFTSSLPYLDIELSASRNVTQKVSAVLSYQVSSNFYCSPRNAGDIQTAKKIIFSLKPGILSLFIGKEIVDYRIHLGMVPFIQGCSHRSELLSKEQSPKKK
jgi:hypothetical protein